MSPKTLIASLLVFALLSVPFIAVVRADETTAEGAEKSEDFEAVEEVEELPELEKSEEQKAIDEAAGSAAGHTFQTEVSQLLDIIIHSLYSKREIFLRELISNAADAMDKIRFLSLTDAGALGEGEQAELDIKIKYDHERRLLHIIDKGIGMTRQDLLDNLGTIARSGTKNFLKSMEDSEGDLNMIGQFGVGFYSAFLVADEVTVITKHNDDNQMIWKSKADANFAVMEDPRGNTLGRGTQVILHLKDDAVEEFGSEDNLREIIKRYSEFVNFPIFLWTTEFEQKEVPMTEEENAAAIAEEQKALEDNLGPEDSDEEEIEFEDSVEGADEDSDDESEDEIRYKTIDIDVSEYQRVNTQPPIWMRSREEVTEEEYTEFAKALQGQDPSTHIHFSAEGKVNFRSILFAPERAPYDAFGQGTKPKVKLYVRRVFITDNFEDLIPRYLNFVNGVVDSDDMDLNVSREMLQESKTMEVIKKKVVRKAIEMIQRLAKDEEKEEREYQEKLDAQAAKESEEPAEDEDTETEEEEDAEIAEPSRKYSAFWKEFGKNIRLGMIEDTANRNRLTKLMRFETSKRGGKLISFEQYLENMGENQEEIYYITGESVEDVERSPFLSALKERDLEVIYFVDAIDEYVVQHVHDYDNKKLVSITKEGLELPAKEGEEDLSTRRNAYYKSTLSSLLTYLKVTLGGKIDKAVISERLGNEPAMLTTSKWGHTANMERIMRAQALSTGAKAPKSSKIMEVNPRHPLIQALQARISNDGEDSTASDIAKTLYDMALVQSGFSIDDQEAFAKRMLNIMSRGLELDTSAGLEDPVSADDLDAFEAERENSGETENDDDVEDFEFDMGDLNVQSLDMEKEEL